MRARIHAKAGGAGGLVPQHVPGNIVQQRLGSGLPAGRRRGDAAGQDGEGGGSAQRSKKGAAGKRWGDDLVHDGMVTDATDPVKHDASQT